jgi:hypothetical protein
VRGCWPIERRPAKLLRRDQDIADGFLGYGMIRGLIVGGLGCSLGGAAYLALAASPTTRGLVFAGLLLMYGLGQASVGFVLRYRSRSPGSR